MRVLSVSSFLAWVIVTVHPGGDSNAFASLSSDIEGEEDEDPERDLDLPGGDSNVFAPFSFDIEVEEDDDPERDLDLFFLGVDSFEVPGVFGLCGCDRFMRLFDIV